MDATTQRAVGFFHDLLHDEAELRQELEERFLGRMRERGLTFGGRVLCPFPRPNLVSVGVYEEIRAACRSIASAVDKVEQSLGRELWDRVGLRPEERELVEIDPGFRRSSPLGRLDSFLTPLGSQYVELNAETPAGVSYAEELAQVFLELPLLRRFQERFQLRPFHGQQRLLATLLRCYHEAGGREERPTIAVVDYEEVPTRVEHHLAAAFFRSQGCPALVCDPRELVYERGYLRHEGHAIDIVYKRLLVNELLDKRDELGALVDAARDGRVVVVNPFRCKPIHKKAIFAVLTDDALQPAFTESERAAIRAHVPWTRRLFETRTLRYGIEVDLPRYVLDNRERLVLKPNDEYGGKGVVIGWETPAEEWARSLAAALDGSWVVQERVELLRQEFPQLVAEPGEEQARLRFAQFVVDLDPYLFDGEVEGFLTRLSATALANVTAGAGQVPSFLVEPVG